MAYRSFSGPGRTSRDGVVRTKRWRLRFVVGVNQFLRCNLSRLPELCGLGGTVAATEEWRTGVFSGPGRTRPTWRGSGTVAATESTAKR
jgi:hypothetical protein